MATSLRNSNRNLRTGGAPKITRDSRGGGYSGTQYRGGGKVEDIVAFMEGQGASRYRPPGWHCAANYAASSPQKSSR